MKTFQIPCDGYSVDADWYEGEHADNILLSLIGWTSNRQRYAEMLTAIIEMTGMSGLVFDYSGHGDSLLDLNETTQAQHMKEVLSVYDWLRSRFPLAKITVMGSSYGGFMAAHLAQYRAVERLVLRAPAIYDPEDFNKKYKDVDAATTRAYRKSREKLAQDSLLANSRNFTGRTLVVVHEEDQEVPKQTTDAYIQAFNADVYLAQGFPHALVQVSQDELLVYQQRISDWLQAR